MLFHGLILLNTDEIFNSIRSYKVINIWFSDREDPWSIYTTHPNLNHSLEDGIKKNYHADEKLSWNIHKIEDIVDTIYQLLY